MTFLVNGWSHIVLDGDTGLFLGVARDVVIDDDGTTGVFLPVTDDGLFGTEEVRDLSRDEITPLAHADYGLRNELLHAAMVGRLPLV